MISTSNNRVLITNFKLIEMCIKSSFYERVKHLTNRNGILISKIELNNTNRAIHLVEMVERT